MGSPAFAVPALSLLAERPDLCHIVAVVTQPDKAAGRGRKLFPSAIKTAAEARGIPVLQPTKMRSPQTTADLAAFKPDIMVVAAYGRILPKTLLDLPPLGCINIHASLLPKHRGASPIAHAILANDEEAGVGIMQMDEGLDTGAVFAERSISIAPDDTAFTLTIKLAELGATLLADTLPAILNGSLKAIPQSSTGMSYAPLLTKQDGRLDFTLGAEELSRRIRAFSPWPGSFCFLGRAEAEGARQRVQVLTAEVVPGIPNGVSGTVVNCDKQGIVVCCQHSLLRLTTIKPAGKKAMAGGAWVAGRGVRVEDRFFGADTESEST